MAFAISFNYDAGDGQIDPVRVTRNARWGGIPDPLNGDLVFSALYQNAMCEEFPFASPDNPNGWNPRVATNRTYSAPPLVMAVWVNNDGLRFYPGSYADYANVSGTLVPVYWSLYSTCASRGDGTYAVGANVQTTNSAGYFIKKGTLRLYVVGVG